MLFPEFVTTLEISVMMIFPEPGKFENNQLKFLRKKFKENLI